MKNEGVTLLELLIVLAIASVMAAMALPGMGKYFLHRSLDRQANEIVGLFYMVRENAMSSGHKWRMNFSSAQGEIFCYGDENNNAVNDSKERHMGPYRLCKGVVFDCSATSGPNNTKVPTDGVSFSNNRVCYSNMGSCNAGTIYLRSDNESIAVRVLPASGAVRMYVYSGVWKELK